MHLGAQGGVAHRLLNESGQTSFVEEADVLITRGRHRAGGGHYLLSVVFIAATIVGLQGCAAVGLTAFSVVAGSAAGVGVGHAMESITYKTFSLPLGVVSRATVMTLDRLDMPVMEVEDTSAGQTITAQAGDRTVEIELDKLTTTTTRMRVVASKNWLVRDRATAAEVINQTDRTLMDNPGLASRTTQRCAKGASAC